MEKIKTNPNTNSNNSLPTTITLTTHQDEYLLPTPIRGISAPILLSIQETNEDGDWAKHYTYSLQDLTHEDLDFYFRYYLLKDFLTKVLKSSGDDDYYDYLPDYADMVHQFIEQTGIITEQDWESILANLANLCRASHTGGYDGLLD